MNGKYKNKKVWVVYILSCSDDSLYTGMTNDMEKRFAAHNKGIAAKYTRSRRPVKLMATSAKMSRSDALRLEIKIKKQPRLKKINALRETAVSQSRAGIKHQEKASSSQRATGQAVAGLWQIRVKKLHCRRAVQGSPERTVSRMVLEDENGKFFVLEQIPPQSLEHKKHIALLLDYLAKKKLPHIQPYLPAAGGEYVISFKNNYWQMIPFVQGVALNREKYMYDKWRGIALADFLINLRAKSKKLPPGRVFSLRDYVDKLVREINQYNENIKDEINDIASFLENDFMPAYEKLPVAFCHGDYHPLNIIWSVADIKCVLDWEFAGYKSELYDAANLIGCVGVEDPQSLTGDLVKSFIARIKEAGMYSPMSRRYLVEFIIALRFAWLAEWLRGRDTEMIRLELDYLRLLIENRKSLAKAWRIQGR